MKNVKRITVVFLFLMVALAFVTANGQSESGEATFNYPTKAITITNPYKAGGAADVICRQISTLGKDIFDKPVVITNKVGAGGVIAATEFTSTPADPHQLMLVSRSLMVTIPAYQDIPFSYDDFEPVIGIEKVDFILFALASRTDINTLDKLMTYADSHAVTFGTAGVGTDLHLIQSGLLKDAKTPASPVVFGGAKDALNNVLAGNIDIAAAPPAAAIDFVKSGDIVPLGIFSNEAYDGFPGMTVPTFREQGVDISYPGLNFFAVQKGTDPQVIAYLHDKIQEVYDLPAYQEFVTKAGVIHNPLTPGEIDDYIAEQKAVAARLTK